MAGRCPGLRCPGSGAIRFTPQVEELLTVPLYVCARGSSALASSRADWCWFERIAKQSRVLMSAEGSLALIASLSGIHRGPRRRSAPRSSVDPVDLSTVRVAPTWLGSFR